MKTTQLSFAIFKEEVERLTDLFGLKDWNIIIEMDELDKDEAAIIDWDYGARHVRIILASERPKELQTKEEILRSAKHEIAHLLTADLKSLAQARFVTPTELNVAMETFARRMERVI